ncbi:MAG: hypothetical protein QXH07_07425 [Thermoplasmata archaeon]
MIKLTQWTQPTIEHTHIWRYSDEIGEYCIICGIVRYKDSIIAEMV